MNWRHLDLQDVDESATYEQVVDSSQPSLSLPPPHITRNRRFRLTPGIIVSHDDAFFGLSDNTVDEEFQATSILPQQHTFEHFDMFQNGSYFDNISHLVHIDLLENERTLLDVPELAIPAETGLSQYTPERLELQNEPLLDPQMNTSTIL
jgi:hypothetical protein